MQYICSVNNYTSRHSLQYINALLFTDFLNGNFISKLHEISFKELHFIDFIFFHVLEIFFPALCIA